MNQLVKREEILRNLWKEVSYFTGRSLDVYVVKLRKYLQRDQRISIINFHKSGYMLEVRSS
jgi:DNA-binding response OmpR family regulator